MIRELESRFGSVCPLLKLSQHYGLDYTTVLMAADQAIHDRTPVGFFNEPQLFKTAFDVVRSHPQHEEIKAETVKICDWMREQHREAERLEADGRLTFDMAKGKWVQLP